MSWMQQLCSVYDANTEEIGKRTGGVRALKPIFHVTMQAHIEIAIDTDGQLIRGCSRAIAVSYTHLVTSVFQFRVYPDFKTVLADRHIFLSLIHI